MKFLNSILTLLGAVVFYFVFYTLLKSVLPVLPDLNLFRQLDLTFVVKGYRIPAFDMIFFSFGLWVFCHGVLRLASLSEKDHSSKDDLDAGEFGKIRHPVYGAFMTIELGLFVSLRTVYSLCFMAVLIVFQIVASYIEDNYVLKKKFGDSYDEYCNSVKRRFFTPVIIFYYLIAALLTFAGIYFM